LTRCPDGGVIEQAGYFSVTSLLFTEDLEDNKGVNNMARTPKKEALHNCSGYTDDSLAGSSVEYCEEQVMQIWKQSKNI